MTHHNFPQRASLSLEDLDLSPAGLADAPAKEEVQDSIVYTGNS